MKKKKLTIKQQRDLWKQYAELLGKEINDMAGMAWIHGWRSSNVEEGKRLRAKLGLPE